MLWVEMNEQKRDIGILGKQQIPEESVLLPSPFLSIVSHLCQKIQGTPWTLNIISFAVKLFKATAVVF